MGNIYEKDGICIRKQLICARLLNLESNDDVYYYLAYDRVTNYFIDVISERTNRPADKTIIKHIVAKFTKCRKQFAESTKNRKELFNK
jgi:hypothetical protein